MAALSGCGASAVVPLTLSCSTHSVESGFVRANVRVTNNMPSARRAIIYGPVFAGIKHIYPVRLLRPTEVSVRVSGVRRTYIGFTIPEVRPKHPVQLILRFLAPPHTQSIILATQTLVLANDWGFLNNPDCLIRKKG